MHSYKEIKRADDSLYYEVEVLVGGQSHTIRAFEEEPDAAAFANYLNGGDGDRILASRLIRRSEEPE